MDSALSGVLFGLQSMETRATRKEKKWPDLSPRHIIADWSNSLRLLQYTSTGRTLEHFFLLRARRQRKGEEDVEQTDVSEKCDCHAYESTRAVYVNKSLWNYSKTDIFMFLLLSLPTNKIKSLKYIYIQRTTLWELILLHSRTGSVPAKWER